jgi:endo-1,4-beta-xylanase
MRASVFITGLAVFLNFAGCGTTDSGSASNSGGATSSSGKSSASSGGSGSSSSSGGASSSSASSSSASSGGSSSGGTSQSGGSKSTGGTSGRGGSSSESSSADDSGGSGGTSSTDSTASSGGQSATGGTSAKGGTGGSVASGGTTASGGQTSSGGSSASSSERRDADVDARVVPPDAEMCTPTGTCSEPNVTVTSGSGYHCCYAYENWVKTGSCTMTLTTDGFSVNWTGSTQFVGRKGIRPGSGSIVTTYTATFNPNGNSYLTLYGWTTEPLVEYYVVDGWGSWRPPGGTSIGTVTSDGGTYDIYKMTRTNEDSIIGKTTFPQYWSVRQQKKTTGGTITLANHIAAWAQKSMPMGTFYEVAMTVEGYQSSGTADVKFSMK